MPVAAETTTLGHHHYVIRYYDRGTPIGQVPVEPDWTGAVEAARFEGIRRGLLPPVASGGSWAVTPNWHPQLGAPEVGGMTVSVRVGPERAEVTVPFEYLTDAAEAGVAALRAAGRTVECSTLRWVVAAYSLDGTENDGAIDVDTDEDVSRPLRIGSAGLDAFGPMTLSTPTGGGNAEITAGDVPVVIPERVIDVAQARAARTPDIEVGGVLIGHLHRDRDRDDLLVEITDEIPALHTEAAAARLTFTFETWNAVRDQLDARPGDEMMLGFWHVHPFQCRACPTERHATCPFANPFFSADDVHMQQTCFPAAWNVALLLSQCASGDYAVDLFGWRAGRVAARNFYRFEGN